MVYLGIAPMPSPRPRTRVIPRKKPIATIYMPKEYAAWKKEVAGILDSTCSHEELGGPFTGALALECVFAVQRPKKTVRVAPPGDVDNYVKSLMDALTEWGIWNDDVQVRLLSADKRWTNGGEEPHVSFRITEASPP